jgi:hypothetical protein
MVNWIFNDNEFTSADISDYIGFVYIIENISSGRKYIGKKLFHSSKTKQIKGKKKIYKVESDWQSYYGSNAELISDVDTLGQDNFKREIIHLCKSKGMCSYLEAKEQFVRCVMENDSFYNGWIMVRVRKSHLKEFNVRLSKANKDTSTE